MLTLTVNNIFEQYPLGSLIYKKYNNGMHEYISLVLDHKMQPSETEFGELYYIFYLYLSEYWFLQNATKAHDHSKEWINIEDIRDAIIIKPKGRA